MARIIGWEGFFGLLGFWMTHLIIIVKILKEEEKIGNKCFTTNERRLREWV
jgi:hypothetical protein